MCIIVRTDINDDLIVLRKKVKKSMQRVELNAHNAIIIYGHLFIKN